MIPLAATCAFGAGVYAQKNAPVERTIEVRAIYSDREGRNEDVPIAQNLEDDSRERITSWPGAFLSDSAEPLISPLCDAFNVDHFQSAASAQRLLPATLRGPPSSLS